MATPMAPMALVAPAVRVAVGNAPARHTKFTCSGGTQAWTATGTKAKTSPAFKRGPAEICLLATTSYTKVGTTALAQSCRAVSIVLPS